MIRGVGVQQEKVGKWRGHLSVTLEHVSEPPPAHSEVIPHEGKVFTFEPLFVSLCTTFLIMYLYAC